MNVCLEEEAVRVDVGMTSEEINFICPNFKLSHPERAGANLVKVSCRKESPQPGRAAGKGWLQRLVRIRSSVVPKIVYPTA